MKEGYTNMFEMKSGYLINAHFFALFGVDFVPSAILFLLERKKVIS